MKYSQENEIGAGRIALNCFDRYMRASEQIDKLKELLQDVRKSAVAAQEDWSAVDEAYAPEWTKGYKAIVSLIDESEEST